VPLAMPPFKQGRFPVPFMQATPISQKGPEKGFLQPHLHLSPPK
jgi:hypothetical protein